MHTEDNGPEKNRKRKEGPEKNRKRKEGPEKNRKRKEGPEKKRKRKEEESLQKCRRYTLRITAQKRIGRGKPADIYVSQCYVVLSILGFRSVILLHMFIDRHQHTQLPLSVAPSPSHTLAQYNI